MAAATQPFTRCLSLAMKRMILFRAPPADLNSQAAILALFRAINTTISAVGPTSVIAKVMTESCLRLDKLSRRRGASPGKCQAQPEECRGDHGPRHAHRALSRRRTCRAVASGS